MSSLTSFSVPLAQALFSAVWQGTLLAACVALCLRVMPRIPAAARSAIWLAVFLLVAALHLAPLVPSHGPAPMLPQPSLFHVDLRWSLVVAAVWATLSTVRGVRLVGDAWRLRGIARRATPVTPGQDATELLAGSRKVALCTTEEVDRPCVAGFFHTRILVPPALLETLSADALRQVLLHEMEHIRRADDWTNLLQKLGLVLFPINPVLLWVERRLCAERELACDDRVLEATGARKAYATCLANLAEHSVLRRGAVLALRAWEHRSELSRRVQRILARPQPELPGPRLRVVTCALIAGILGFGTTLTRSPQLLTFDRVPSEQAAVAPPAPGGADSHGTGAAGVTLVRASMPSPRPVSVATPVSPRAHRPPVRTAARRSARQQAVATSLLVYTGWRATPHATRIAYAYTEDSQTSYAAVPTPNGWLIFEL